MAPKQDPKPKFQEGEFEFLGKRHLSAQEREAGSGWLRFGGRGWQGLRPEEAADRALCGESALRRVISVRHEEKIPCEAKALGRR